jgi:peptidoglycan/xylan/chitin deacetylase (PgdA/CDA1 family)
VADEYFRELKQRPRFGGASFHPQTSQRSCKYQVGAYARAVTRLSLRLAIVVISLSHPLSAARADCPDPKTALGVARTVEVDASTGGIYGSVTRQTKTPSLLLPKEVVLSFDDGPMPWITRSILDTLDRFCTKAMFFEVGQMALSHPAVTKDVLSRGHTLGTHTMTHPFNLPRIAEARAVAEIEAGFAAVAAAAGAPIAPLFRFPGLADSASLISYLRGRGIAAFTVDVVSNDSYIADKSRLIERTLAAVDRQKGGIILFHDIKSVTAKALPEILAGLKARGYGVVQIKAKEPVHLLPEVVAALAADKHATWKRTGLRPFYAAVEPDRSAPTAALRGYANKKSVKRQDNAAEAPRRTHHRPRSLRHARSVPAGSFKAPD